MTNERLSWKELSSLEIGGAICLPVILVGQVIGSKYGILSALIAIIVGNFFLFCIALATVRMSVTNRLATPDNAKLYFGPIGAKAFACCLLTAKTSWYAIQLGLMVVAAEALLGPNPWLHAVLGIGIMATAIFGLRVLSLFSTLSLPLLIGTMVYAAYIVTGEKPVTHIFSSPIRFEGISIAISAAITAVIDMPTYFMHAKSRKDGHIAAVFLFLVALPLIEGLGVYLASQNPGGNILESMQVEGVPLWNVWVALFLLLAGWTTDNMNLYSAKTCLKSLLPSLPDKAALILLGSLGALLSSLGFLEHFTQVLQFIGVLIGSMGAIVLTSYVLDAGDDQRKIFAWAIGGIVGILALFYGSHITGVAVVDAFLAASLACSVGVKMRRRELT